MSIQKVFNVTDKIKEDLGSDAGLVRLLENMIKYGQSLSRDGLIVKKISGPYIDKDSNDVYILHCDKSVVDDSHIKPWDKGLHDLKFETTPVLHQFRGEVK